MANTRLIARAAQLFEQVGEQIGRMAPSNEQLSLTWIQQAHNKNQAPLSMQSIKLFLEQYPSALGNLYDNASTAGQEQINSIIEQSKEILSGMSSTIATLVQNAQSFDILLAQIRDNNEQIAQEISAFLHEECKKRGAKPRVVQSKLDEMIENSHLAMKIGTAADAAVGQAAYDPLKRIGVLLQEMKYFMESMLNPDGEYATKLSEDSAQRQTQNIRFDQTGSL